MTHLLITGCGVLSPAGMGLEALSVALSDRSATCQSDVSKLYDDPVPSPMAHALVDFNVRQLLGRKGTTFLDRRTSLTLAACAKALEDSGIQISDENRESIGIILGTTWGSLKSMCDYTRDTLIEERPYLVNPAFFPNTVMNCAAGQAAIRFGLKGVNATIAGGELAFLSVLRYATNILQHGRANVVLAGAVEEYTPHTAWATHLIRSNSKPASGGEGAAVFVIQSGDAKSKGIRSDAEVLGVSVGFCPEGEASGKLSSALERCILGALTKANVEPHEVSIVSSCEPIDDYYNSVERNALARVLGAAARVKFVSVKHILGNCYAALGAFQFAALQALHRNNPELDGQLSLITGWMRDGGVGAAVVRGWQRVGSDHR